VRTELAIRLAGDARLRRGEILAFRSKNVDLVRGVLHVRQNDREGPSSLHRSVVRGLARPPASGLVLLEYGRRYAAAWSYRHGARGASSSCADVLR